MFSLKINLQLSKQISALYIMLLSGAIAGSCLLPIVVGYKLGLIAFLIFAAYQLLQRYAWLQSKNSIVALQWLSEKEWLLISKAGQTMQGRLLGDSLISPFLMVLNFKIADHWRIKSIQIMPDSADPQILRQFRVHLRVLNRVKAHAKS